MKKVSLQIFLKGICSLDLEKRQRSSKCRWNKSSVWNDFTCVVSFFFLILSLWLTNNLLHHLILCYSTYLYVLIMILFWEHSFLRRQREERRSFKAWREWFYTKFSEVWEPQTPTLFDGMLSRSWIRWTQLLITSKELLI